VAQKAHYLVRVKANTQSLLKQIQAQTCFDSPTALHQTNHKKDNLIKREIHCFPYQNQLDQWAEAQIATAIRVERTFMRKEGPHLETAYYISSHHWSEHQAALAIRNHWHIENRLHWVKDVVLKEDLFTPTAENAPKNMALINNLVVCLYRKNVF